ncbi:hypothetical protein N7495_008383 [Penicillium taxi]|uniref:uncharacterized protein n=1 Tax=Penicillium taxi TaxID=168475 RepID=UPI0025451D71|nr:uncharacterized protein N7495_008383 [Penicillium taxi]KAJ5888342.1 hypothetical protein N7495_008383 [Penicillium taxi]
MPPLDKKGKGWQLMVDSWEMVKKEKMTMNEYDKLVLDLKDQQKKLPGLAMSSLKCHDICKILDLMHGLPTTEFAAWLVEIRCSFGHSELNETNIRLTLDYLLVLTKKLVTDELPPKAQPISLQVESMWEHGPVTHKGMDYRLTGKPDYTVWYGETETMAASLVVVEAKTEMQADSGIGKCVGYMRMV